MINEARVLLVEVFEDGGGAFRRFEVTDGSFSGIIGSSIADGISLFTISSGEGDRDIL